MDFGTDFYICFTFAHRKNSFLGVLEIAYPLKLSNFKKVHNLEIFNIFILTFSGTFQEMFWKTLANFQKVRKIKFFYNFGIFWKFAGAFNLLKFSRKSQNKKIQNFNIVKFFNISKNVKNAIIEIP